MKISHNVKFIIEKRPFYWFLFYTNCLSGIISYQLFAPFRDAMMMAANMARIPEN